MPRTLVPVVSLVSLALAGSPTPVLAQSADAIGVRAQGMAGAFTAVADDATAVWWNPAGLATGAYFNAIVEAGNDHHGGISVAYPALGLSYYRLRVNQIQPSSPTDASSAGRQDPGTADVRLHVLDTSQFGATVGQSVGRNLVIGSTLKLLRGGGSTRGDLDVGVMAVAGPMRVGVTARNLTRPTLGDGSDRLTLDRQVRAEVALVSADRGHWGLTLALDADVTKTKGAGAPSSAQRDQGTGASGVILPPQRWVAAGAEIWTASRRLGGRAGLNWNTLNGGQGTGSVGASVAVRSGAYLDVQLSHLGDDRSGRSAGAALRVTF